EDQVVGLEQLHSVVGLQPDLVQANVDQRVDLLDGVARAFGLRPADIGLSVDDLALQIGFIDDVELDDSDGPDSRGGQVQQRRRAEPARADDQHARVLQPLLTVEPEVGDDQVAAIARDLFARQLFRGLYQRRQRCGHTNTLLDSKSGLISISTVTHINGNQCRGLPRRYGMGYGQGFGLHVLPSALTHSGSKRELSLSLVEKVCCIITGASCPSSPHGSWCSYPMAWPTSWLIRYCR